MVLLVIMISGCAKNQPGQDKPEKLTESNFKTVVLTVEGITWNSCTAKVEGELSGLDGVKQAKAELSGKTTVVYDPAKVTVEKMKKAISDIGYKVKE